MSASILVPLDGSSFGEYALPVALGIARRGGARVHVVHVHEPPLPLVHPYGVTPYDDRIDREMLESERAYLDGVARMCRERCGLVVRPRMLSAPVVNSLVSYASEAAIDLIVMTTHGRGGINRAWLGSVADALVRRTSVPVLLLRPHDGSAEIDCEPRTQHILIPMDGSELSQGILEPAIALAEVSQARITLLEVTSPVYVNAEEQGAEREHATQRMEQIAARLRERGLETDVVVATHALPAVAILDHAAHRGVDLIALATHGRGGWSRVALGSVADKVVRGSMMPVLLYRPPGASVRHVAGIDATVSRA